MKKLLSLTFLFLVGTLFFLSSCKEDDDPDPEPGADPIEVTGIEANEGFSEEGRIYTKIGATLTFTGSGFSSVVAENTVTLGGLSATVTNASETSLTVTIPEMEVLNDNVDFVEIEVGDETYNSGSGLLVKIFPENTEFISDADVESGSWTNDNVYLIDGYVFVEGDLEIEEGTVIMGTTNPFASNNASSLIVTTSGTIDAVGTPTDPIIFTSESDKEALGGEPNLDGTDVKGWAGLVLLGEATIGNGSGTAIIEGVEGDATIEAKATFGGDNDADNSGTLKYVSIRFSGAEIGPGDEIQGLTLGGIGSGTTLEYIDIFASSDDGVEIFGGSVVIKYFSIAFAEDDSYDFDWGWDGYGQFLFALQRSDDADHGGEWDGASPDDNPRYTNARFYNATLLGRGKDETTEDETSSQAIVMRDGNAMSIYNSIIGDFGRRALQIEDRGEDMDSYDKLVNDGVNEIAGNIWFELEGDAFVPSDEEGSLVVVTVPEDDETFTPADATAAAVATHLADNWNIYLPSVDGIVPDRNQGGNGLSVVPTASEVTENIVVPTKDAASGDEYEEVSYKGAFEPGETPWIAGWTTLARFGYLAE